MLRGMGWDGLAIITVVVAPLVVLPLLLPLLLLLYPLSRRMLHSTFPRCAEQNGRPTTSGLAVGT